MNGDVSIDLGSALPYLEQRILGLFGKDSASADFKNRLKNTIRLSEEQAAFVQCVGMHTPIPIDQIYQPTRLRRSQAAEAGAEGFSKGTEVERSAYQLLAANEDAVVFAGPGWGKTTLVHHLYCTLAKQSCPTPVLFTLRWPGVVAELEEFVNQLSLSSSKLKLVLLVDGYDEITSKERLRVSRALILFNSLKRGPFLLTCRTFYDVYDIKANRYDLCPFTQEDAKKFIRAFAQIYGVSLDEQKTVLELQGRGFTDFLSHPLMLTLVCILKTGPNQEIPRRAIGLIRRALETLTFRWDDAKRVRRESFMPLDGEERIRCLMRVAFGMPSLAAPWVEVERHIRDHLRLVQLPLLNPAKLLEELARFYGILVPVGDNNWQFVHRTIQDYLAARYWVESGEFAASAVPDWNMRAAYAACLLPNATPFMTRMLAESKDDIAFRECLHNRAPFEVDSVAAAVISRANRMANFTLEASSRGPMVESADTFFSAASPELLRRLVQVGSRNESQGGEAVALLALSEMHSRGIRANRNLLHGRLRDLLLQRGVAVDKKGEVPFMFADAFEA